MWGSLKFNLVLPLFQLSTTCNIGAKGFKSLIAESPTTPAVNFAVYDQRSGNALFLVGLGGKKDLFDWVRKECCYV